MNGLTNKIDELRACLSVYDNISVICITETHLKNTVLDAEIEIEGYRFFRKDRNFNIKGNDTIMENEGDHYSMGGGSIIYYRNDMNAKIVKDFSEKAPNSLALELDSNVGRFCVACVYRSPNLSITLNKKLLSCIKEICKTSNTYETIVVGDFNLPDVSWETGNIKCSHLTQNDNLLNQMEYMELFNELGMKWFLTNETARRRLVNGVLQESILDQVLFTNEALVTDVKLLASCGKSDHISMKIELGVSLSKELSPRTIVIKKPNWSKVSINDILDYSYKNIDWDSTLLSSNAEESWNQVYNNLCQFNKIAPIMRCDSSNRPLNSPWNNSALKRIRRSKYRAWNCFRDNPITENLNYAKFMDKSYSDKEFRLKLDYEKSLTNNLKDNCKGLYSYLRNKRNLKTSIPSLEKHDGSRTRSAAENAEVLADAFSSVFVLEPECLPDGMYTVHTNEVLTEIIISTEDVRSELKTLNCFKSLGPDGIHPKVLKALADDVTFVESLINLFRICADTGYIPKIRKSANITALFKNGSKTDPLNYRPVSLTCIVSKIYEKIIKSSIIQFIDSKVNKHQHGFVKGKSCLTNLLETMNCIIDIIDQGDPVDIFYFDFRKAFDRVPHKRLLYKLECLGIKGKVLNIIRNFLSGRTFRVCLEGEFSNVKDVLSGIPQWTVLGPLLFILYINDLPDSIKSFAKLFADDLKMIAKASDKGQIDNDLKNLELWEITWLLEFNVKKCKVLHTTFNNNSNNIYYLDGNVMDTSDQEKDLGVLTTCNLLWNDQISSCINKSSQMNCFITRNLISREKSLMLRIYKTLIRPNLEYCVQLWSPAPEHGNWSMILKIEGVQRRFTRMIEDIGLLPYSERLDILGLTTLVECRARGDLIEVYKAKHGFSLSSDVFKFGRSGLNLLSKFGHTSNAKCDALKRNCLSERVREYWNRLPFDVKMAPSINSFKN